MITLEHYRKLGGFDAIVGEHLDRVLDTELADGRDVIARDLFVALVTTAHERAIRSESELLAMVSSHPAAEVTAVLELLRSRGLLVRVRGANDDPSWELIHDSLVPRVLSWVDRRDLTRRRAIELVRYHLRRSRPDAPSLLGRAELRELKPHTTALGELDAEWKTRVTSANDWTPARLVARSRQVLHRRTFMFAGIITVALSLASVGFYRSHVESERAEKEAMLKSSDRGRFTLSIEPFDWDPVKHVPIPVDVRTVSFDWTLHAIDPNDPTQPGPLLDPVVRSTPQQVGNAIVEAVEARGGHAFLAIARKGCTRSIIPLKQIPGYAVRDREPPTFHIVVPTCAVTEHDMIEIAAGAFIYGGVGEPPSPYMQAEPEFAVETRIELPTFRIDRTEVTNAAFEAFTKMSTVTGIVQPAYPNTREFEQAMALPDFPVMGIDWEEASAYCRFLGKRLPTSEQWVRALRGGERLRDGTPNPWPRRNYPWGVSPPEPTSARLLSKGESGPARVGTFPKDVSPDGVLDLAGNVYEWTQTMPEGGEAYRVTRGGNYADVDPEQLVNLMAIPNARLMGMRSFAIGLRCASTNE
jgi:formylglycine-generating enzyme required for sulfatase activity